MIDQSIPPAYHKHPQFDEKCSCGTPLAIHQRKFEEITKENMEKGMKLNEARIVAINSLGVRKMCCLRELTFFARNFIFDVTTNAFCDITYQNTDSTLVKSQSTKINYKQGSQPYTTGYEFLPLTNNVVGFDQNAYAIKLFMLSSSNFDKLGLRRDFNQSNNIPIFANFGVVKAENFPEVQSDSVPLTVDELINLIKT